MGFVGEAIVPDVDTIDAAELARGEPALPRAFTWRDTRYEVESIRRTWRSYKLDRGDKYVDRHWFEIQTSSGEQMRIYFDRRPRTLRRWWLFWLGHAPEVSARSDDVLDRYLDESGRVKTYPAKWSAKRRVLEYLASKFEPGRNYNEREIDDVLRAAHTFGDWPLLRRDLYDLGFINRSPDGARYWR